MNMKSKPLLGLILIGLLLAIIISVKNAVWFESMMVNKMLAEQYPNQKPGISRRLSTYFRLYQKGNEAAKQLEGAKKIWNSSDAENSEYYDAANVIVADLEINKKEWLTIGNIIKYFGVPDNIDGLFPVTDNEGNVLVIPYKYDVYFENKKVRFNFSLSGFLESVMQVSDSGNKETGKILLRWPHDYSCAKHFPIYAGFEYDREMKKSILNRTKKRIKEAIRKGAFYRNLEALTLQEKNLIDIKKMEIYMVDGMNKDLAKVYFHFHDGDMTVWYGPWFTISEDEKKFIAEENNKSKGKIIASKNKRIRELFYGQAEESKEEK